MKRLEVTILGQSYLLSCPEGGETALVQAATRVDREMCAIRDAGKLKARERIAVLAALNLAFELSQRREDAATASNGDANDAPRHAVDARIGRLVARIDEVLTDDGRLL